MDNQHQQNNRSSNVAAGEEIPEPLYTRFQKETRSSTKKGSSIARFFCPWLKKSTATNVQQSTEQGLPTEIPDPAPKPASVDTSIVHGYENEELWLVRCLIKPDDGDFKAIGIFGMPEVGKTALARLVFENDYVKHHFLPRIWVSVCEIKIPNKKQQVAETILKGLDVNEEIIAEFAQGGVAALLYAVHLKLAGRRYLIVLDGVSKDDDCCRNLISPADDEGGENKYEEFSFAFPKGSGGAVIVTSRRKETAEKMVEGEIKEETLHGPRPIEDPHRKETAEKMVEGETKEKISHTPGPIEDPQGKETAEKMVKEKKKGKILYSPRPIEDPHSCFLIYNSVLKEKVKTITVDLEREIRMKSGGLPMAARLMAEIKNNENDQPQNGLPDEQDHQNVASGAENNETVPSQDLQKDEHTHGDSQLEDQGTVNPQTDDS
ncbi:hypothetical protein SLA2020_313960 [Shorea laevis]